MSGELEALLRLVSEGRITAEEAAPIVAALEEKARSDARVDAGASAGGVSGSRRRARGRPTPGRRPGAPGGSKAARLRGRERPPGDQHADPARCGGVRDRPGARPVAGPPVPHRRGDPDRHDRADPGGLRPRRRGSHSHRIAAAARAASQFPTPTDPGPLAGPGLDRCCLQDRVGEPSGRTAEPAWRRNKGDERCCWKSRNSPRCTGPASGPTTASTLPSTRARSSACSATTAPARRRSSTRSSGC